MRSSSVAPNSRAGITRVILPRDNEADLEDLPREVRDKIEVSPVETLAEGLAVTLRDTSLSEGRLLFGRDGSGELEGPISH